MEEMKFCKVRDVKSIAKAHDTDAGFDFFVPNDFEETVIQPGKDLLIPSGVKVKVPHGYALIAFNKSGVATKLHLQVGACVVDENYAGEVHVHVNNIGEQPVTITPGMKIMQFVLVQIGNHMSQEISVEEYEKAMSESERGAGGFGSTGMK